MLWRFLEWLPPSNIITPIPYPFQYPESTKEENQALIKYWNPTFAQMVNLDIITSFFAASVAIGVAPHFKRIFMRRPKIQAGKSSYRIKENAVLKINTSPEALFKITTPTVLTSFLSAHVLQIFYVQMSVSLYLDDFKKEFPDGEMKNEIIQIIDKIKSRNEPMESIFESIKYRTSGDYKFEVSKPKNVEGKERDSTSLLETKNKTDNSIEDLMAYLEAKHKSNKPK